MSENAIAALFNMEGESEMKLDELRFSLTQTPGFSV